MAIVHGAIRRDLVRCRILLTVVGAERLAPGRRQAFGAHLQFLARFIRWHHHGEDRIMHPELITRDPGLRGLIEEMSRGHEAIAQAVQAMEAAGRDLEAGECPSARLLRVVAAVEEALLPHLAQEEHELMFHVARTLSQKEWRHLALAAWVRHQPQEILAANGAFILDNQTPDDVAWFRAGIPVVLEDTLIAMYGARYRHRRALLWTETTALDVPALSVEARAMYGATMTAPAVPAPQPRDGTTGAARGMPAQNDP